MKRNVIIVGSRGYKFNYGGWETFVTELVKNYNDDETKFYIPYLTFNQEEDKLIKIDNNIENINLYVPRAGFATMFNFTIKSMDYFLDYCKNNNMENTILMLLGCKIGPLMRTKYYKAFNSLGIKIIINPDGLEWKRDKWSWWIKQCFKISEHDSIKYSDCVVCDSKAIKEYVDVKYKDMNKNTNFIAYGAYLDQKVKDKDKCIKFLKDHGIEENNYYLVVGRFVPENNIELILKEFIHSNTTKKLVIVTNYTRDKFYDYLIESTRFNDDERINLVGAVYDQDILRYLRINAYAYIHGHSAGGTNPSLLEALSLTKMNILYDISYNREVGENAVMYFSKRKSELAKDINECDKLTNKQIDEYGKLAKERITNEYTWDIVVDKYKKLFDEL